MADKFTIHDNEDGLVPENLDESFFEEFSFDDFDDDVGETDKEEGSDNTKPEPEEEPYKTGSVDSVGVLGAETEEPVTSPRKPLGHVADYNYEKMLGDADILAPKTEIEPDDPMLSEFESALAAEIQRVTREREEERRRIAAARSLRRAEKDSSRGAAETRNSNLGISGESIRAGGWYDSDRRGGWSRRRRSQPAQENVIGRVPQSVSPKEPPVRPEIRSNEISERERQAAEEARALEAEKLQAREEERKKAAEARAERLKAAKAAQAEAERLSAIAREVEAEEDEQRRTEALQAALAADQDRVRAEAEKEAFEAAKREGEEREEFEAAARNLQAPKTPELELYDDDDDDDDDEEGGRGRIFITVAAILIILLLGVGAGMTFFWSNLSMNRQDNGANNPVSAAPEDISAGVAENTDSAAEAEASTTMTPDESRYLEDSRAAQAVFEEEQKAALARAAELEQEERAAKMAEAGMLGLPDISTRDLSEFLTEMPAEGKSICTTSTAQYSYDQMVKDLYFMTVQYGDYISMSSLGNTLDQRAIYQAIIGNVNAANHIVIYYALDGSEYMNTVLVMNQLEYYCKARKNGTSYKNHSLDSLFEDVCIHVIPMANPDGSSIAQYGIDSLRTVEARDAMQKAYDADVIAGRTTEPIEQYAAKYSANAAGVDLDRNFSIGWAEYTGGPDTPSASGYKGVAALSEPETQAIVNLVESFNAVSVIGFGSPGNAIEYGFGYEGPAELGISEQTNIGTEALLTALTEKTGYTPAEIPRSDEETGGCATEFFLFEKHIPAVKVETGSGEVPLDQTEMSSIWKANSEIFHMIGNLYTNGL